MSGCLFLSTAAQLTAQPGGRVSSAFVQSMTSCVISIADRSDPSHGRENSMASASACVIITIGIVRGVESTHELLPEGHFWPGTA